MNAREEANRFRQTHFLTIALAAKAGKENDLREACNLAEAELRHLLESALPPEGWQVVPKEPTERMCFRGGTALDPDGEVDVARAYRAMLASAPAPPSPQDDTKTEEQRG